jgi:hypothetical protein
MRPGPLGIPVYKDGIIGQLGSGWAMSGQRVGDEWATSGWWVGDEWAIDLSQDKILNIAFRFKPGSNVVLNLKFNPCLNVSQYFEFKP